MTTSRETSTTGLKCIGRGAFSTVYRKNRSTVLIKSNDPVKECMSLGWFPSSRLFPKIERIAICEDEESSIYEQKHFDKVRKVKGNLSQYEYEFYCCLRKLTPEQCSYESFYNTEDMFREIPNKFHHKKTALCAAVDALTNYGSDIRFEISPHNIAIASSKLVLLDCFFFSSVLRKARN